MNHFKKSLVCAFAFTVLLSACKKEGPPPPDCSTNTTVQQFVALSDTVLITNAPAPAVVTSTVGMTITQLGLCKMVYDPRTYNFRIHGEGSDDIVALNAGELASDFRNALKSCKCGL